MDKDNRATLGDTDTDTDTAPYADPATAPAIEPVAAPTPGAAAEAQAEAVAGTFDEEEYQPTEADGDWMTGTPAKKAQHFWPSAKRLFGLLKPEKAGIFAVLAMVLVAVVLNVIAPRCWATPWTSSSTAWSARTCPPA
jgi:ATP-binding cassette subfamily B multidrug efflux pump